MSTLSKIQKLAAAPLAATLFTANVQAQEIETHAPDTWDVGAIARINTKLGSDGSCRQILPNLVGTAKSDDWTLRAALKVDNLEASDGCFGDHNTRLFFLNGTYKGLQDQGTTIDFGLFEPYRLAKSPLVQGFTPVILDDAHQLYGGITGIKVNQVVASNTDTTLTLDGMIGTKPDGLERFGPTADLVTAAGVNLKHNFTDRLSTKLGGRVIHFEDDVNPSGTDVFVDGTVKYHGNHADFEVYGEFTEGERSNDLVSKDTDTYSLLGRATFDMAPKTQWEIAAGAINGDPAAETSVYHDFENGFRGTVGYGYNFETDDHTARVGLVRAF